MRLSKRSEYGVRAMILLARRYGENEALSIKNIAIEENIPLKFLEQILLTLKNTGFLRSRKGVGGGYSMAQNPDKISLGSIIRVLDGPLAPLKCVSQMAYEPCDCKDENTCGLRLVMLDVRSAIVEILDRTTLADVANRVNSQNQIAQVEYLASLIH